MTLPTQQQDVHDLLGASFARLAATLRVLQDDGLTADEKVAQATRIVQGGV